MRDSTKFSSAVIVIAVRILIVIAGEANEGECPHVTAYLLEKCEWAPLFLACILRPCLLAISTYRSLGPLVQVGAPEAKAPANYLHRTYFLLLIVLKVPIKFVTPLGSVIEQF